MNDKRLRTYLNDHLAGAAAGLQLARDCRDHNPSGPYRRFLSELVTDIEEDYQTLRNLYARVHSRENPLKKIMTWLVSKISRLKLENLLFQYTDLTRLEELEALVLGVRGKLALWEVLEVVCASDERFSDVDFQHLQTRAREQLDQLEKHRRKAARTAFAS